MSATKKIKLSELEEVQKIDKNTLTNLLSSYTATLTRKDQEILRKLREFDRSDNVDFAKLSPVVWGPKSVEIYENLRSLGPSLWNRATENDVLELFEDQKMWLSALRFPLDLPIEISKSEDLFELNPHYSDIYDPRFCLTIFARILAPESPINCKKFIEKNCLALILGSLSCKTVEIRCLAVLALSRFLFHLKAVNSQFTGTDAARSEIFWQKSQFVYLITLLKNSLDGINKQRIPCVISHFLIRICRLFQNPEDAVYSPLNAFLLLKPTLDLENVPEFYKLFHSSSSENFKRERHWVLHLLADGLRESRDYHILEKRYGIKLFLSFFDSALADEKSRELILRILKAAASISTAAFDLYHTHNLIGWITNAVNFRPIGVREGNDEEPIRLKEKEAELFVELFLTLWISVGIIDKSVDIDLEKEKKPVFGAVQGLNLVSFVLCCNTLSALGKKSEHLTRVREEITKKLL